MTNISTNSNVEINDKMTSGRILRSFLDSYILHYVEVPLDDLPVVDCVISNPKDKYMPRVICDVSNYEEIDAIDQQIEKALSDIDAQIIPTDLSIDTNESPGKQNVEVELL